MTILKRALTDVVQSLFDSGVDGEQYGSSISAGERAAAYDFVASLARSAVASFSASSSAENGASNVPVGVMR